MFSDILPCVDVLAEAGHHPMGGEGQTDENVYRAIFGIKSVHFLAIFAVIYIGVEVTLGGMRAFKSFETRSIEQV